MHGLQTTSPTTWIAYNDSYLEGALVRKYVNWLSDDDMLPAQVPNARIWTFNYNSDWAINAPATRISVVAETFLTSITDKLQLEVSGDAILSEPSAKRSNKGVKRRPLVFIASSFGGLVVAHVRCLDFPTYTCSLTFRGPRAGEPGQGSKE